MFGPSQLSFHLSMLPMGLTTTFIMFGGRFTRIYATETCIYIRRTTNFTFLPYLIHNTLSCVICTMTRRKFIYRILMRETRVAHGKWGTHYNGSWIPVELSTFTALFFIKKKRLPSIEFESSKRQERGLRALAAVKHKFPRSGETEDGRSVFQGTFLLNVLFWRGSSTHRKICDKTSTRWVSLLPLVCCRVSIFDQYSYLPFFSIFSRDFLRKKSLHDFAIRWFRKGSLLHWITVREWSRLDASTSQSVLCFFYLVCMYVP